MAPLHYKNILLFVYKLIESRVGNTDDKALMVLNALLSEIYLEKAWSLSSFSAERFRELVPVHLTLNLQYQLFASTVDVILKNIPPNHKQIRLQAKAAHRLGEVLTCLYKDYLADPHEVAKIKVQQQIYEELLQGTFLELPAVESSFVRKVRTNTAEVNLYRLLFVRSKRAADILASLNLFSQTQDALLTNFNAFANPFLMTLSWLYFTPRLAVNVFLLMKHGIKGPWMSQEEHSLPLKTRLITQLQQCWFELGNDLVWFSAGCLTHLAWLGVLPPVSIYLTLAFFVYDLVASGIRFCLEIERLISLEKACKKLDTLKAPNNLDISNEEIKEIQILLEKALTKQIRHDLLRLGMHLGISTAIVLCIACALPVFAANPLIPVAGAVSLALLCVVNFIAAWINNASRPENKISPSALGFFKRNFPIPSADLDATVPKP